MSCYYKAVFNLNRSIAEKAKEERTIHAKMSVNPLFPDPPIGYADFLAAINAQTVAVDNAEFGDRENIAIMREKELIVDNMVRKYRSYVTEVADGNTVIILSSGFKHTKPRTRAGDMDKVTGVKNLNSKLSGGLKLKWNPVENVAFYEVETREVVEKSNISPALPQAESSNTNEDASNQSGLIVLEREWKPTGSKGSRIEITGLKSLRHYEVRVRAKGAKGYGPYSDIVIIPVL